MRHIILLASTIILLLFNNTILAQSFFDGNTQPLNESEAFSIEYEKRKSGHSILINIKDGYYLYKDTIKIDPVKKTRKNIPSETIQDKFYGKISAVKYSFSIFLEPKQNYNLSFQGCSPEHNICYQPQHFNIIFDNNNNIFLIEKTNNFQNEKKEKKSLIETAKNSNFFIKLGIFFIIGIGISLTPCVLPMIPIISSMIVNSSKNNIKPHYISLSYISGSATLYGIIGFITTLGFFGIQGYIQNKWFIIISSLVIAMFSLLMIDKIKFYKNNSISYINNKINNKINNIKFDFKNSFLIGFLSSMILSPCVAAPLGALLIYTTTLSNPFEAFSYLFSFGIGSGFILILASNGLKKINPQKFIIVKYIISLLLLFISVFLISRIILNEWIIYNLYIFSFVLISFFYSDDFNLKSFKYFLLLLIFVFNIFYLNKPINNNNIENNNIEYIKNLNEIPQKEEYFIIKVYADWCVYCRDMEKNTFNNFNSNYNVYTLDITSMNSDKRKILTRYNAISAPAIIKFNNGSHIDTHNGFISKKDLNLFLYD